MLVSLAPQAASSTATAPGRRVRDGAARYAAIVRTILRRRLPAIAGFTVLMLLVDFARAWAIGMVSAPSLAIVARVILLQGGLVTVVVATPALVEAAGLSGWRRIVATFGVMLALVCLVLVAVVEVHPGPFNGAVREGLVTSTAAFLMRMGWVYFTAGLLFAVFCHARDRELAAIHAARTATLERAGAERDIVEMRLQVIQARVEPEILFGALADVRAAYARDTAAADALLDDLIAYLRAALPQMRKGASTVAREAGLAQAYLRVAPAGRDGRLVAELVLDDRAHDEPFPPLVLLPLVHAAADAGARLVRIVARSSASSPGRTIEVELAGDAIPAGWSDDALAGVRAILAGSVGPTARLHIAVSDGRATARIQWRADDADDADATARATTPAPGARAST